MNLEEDSYWMAMALAQARLAETEGEVPVGAVVVRNGELLATGRNATIATQDPSAHAEMLALRAAAQALGNHRLSDCTLYVTLEPCPMCSGAILHARLARLVFGAPDPKTGSAGSVLNVFEHAGLNPHTSVTPGVLALECGAVLRDFFRPKRQNLSPLRDDALRTPESAFANCPSSGLPSHWWVSQRVCSGLRLHVLDSQGRAEAGRLPPLVMLHGPWGWSQDLADWALTLQQAGAGRVLMPDLAGFGRSDKPKKQSWHRVDILCDLLSEWLDAMVSGACVLVVPECEPLLQLAVDGARRQPERWCGVVTWAPDRFSRTVTRQADARAGPRTARQAPAPLIGPAAYHAMPFPDRGHLAGPQAWWALREASLIDGRQVQAVWAAWAEAGFWTRWRVAPAPAVAPDSPWWRPPSGFLDEQGLPRPFGVGPAVTAEGDAADAGKTFHFVTWLHSRRSNAVSTSS